MGYGLPVIGKAIVALATVWPIVVFGRILDRFGKGLRGAPRDALIADAAGYGVYMALTEGINKALIALAILSRFVDLEKSRK